jgi:hypothetical protein
MNVPKALIIDIPYKSNKKTCLFAQNLPLKILRLDIYTMLLDAGYSILKIILILS